MKYWLLTTEYPPFYGGGISTYCYHTACMLSEQKHVVTVFVCDKTVDSILIEKLPEARIIRFNPSLTNSHSFLGYETNISYEFAHVVKSFIEKEGQPDIIESQDYNGIAYFLLQYKYCLYDWCKDLPIVITMHSPSFLYMEYNQVPLYKQPNYWIGEMERFCMQAADLLISPSAYLVDEIKKRFKLQNNNLHVIPNPYKTNASAPIEHSVSNNQITFLGKLSAQKGTFKILEQFKTLWDKGTKTPFTMIGGQDIVFHPLSKTMGELVKKQYSEYIQKDLLKLENKIAPSEIETRLSTYLFFIIPSIVENLPYVALELMSQGKILIASNSGGQAEIITNNTDGFIFDYSKNDFETVLNKALQLSKEEKQLMSQKAALRIKEHYAYDKIYNQKIKVIDALLKQPTNRNEFPFIIKLASPLPPTIVHKEYKRNELLSIIIPYYNLGKYIDDTINSILNATYKNIEILIVNDGSTDAFSIKKLDDFKNHSIVKIIHKENSGLAGTRNYAASIASGAYIAFLDADDTVAKTYYEKAIAILAHYKNVHFVGAWTRYFGNSKNSWPTFNPEPPLILTHNTINSSALVYKKDSFLKAGINDISFKIGLEDYESVVSMLANGLNGVAIPETLFNYRVRNKSMIKGVNNEVRKEYYTKIVTKHQQFFKNFENEIDKLIESNKPALHNDNSTLDDLPFNSIPVLNKITKTLINKSKSNPFLKKYLLVIKRLLPK